MGRGKVKLIGRDIAANFRISLTESVCFLKTIYQLALPTQLDYELWTGQNLLRFKLQLVEFVDPFGFF